jgi:hypothetical protein
VLRLEFQMDRNGKKPKATHDDPPHPERSDTKAHIRDVAESDEAENKAATEKAAADERETLATPLGHKGPQHLE